MPKIATDDALLFGSLALTAIGAGLVVGAATADITFAIGAVLMVFGFPAVLITFMAAGEPES